MGGGHFHCFQKSELFVACLSGFWFREMLLGRLEQKMFPAETKKNEGMNGPDPLLKAASKAPLQPLMNPLPSGCDGGAQVTA